MLVSITTLATNMHPQGGEHWQMCEQARVTMVLPLPLHGTAATGGRRASTQVLVQNPAQSTHIQTDRSAIANDELRWLDQFILRTMVKQPSRDR